MLATFDKYSNGLIAGVLLLYIINTILIQSNQFSIVLFVFFAGFQLLRLRKNIIKLSFIQIGIIIAIFFATIALLVFLFMWLNHLDGIGIISMPDWVMFVIQITIIILFLVALSTGIHKLYLRFTQSKA
jgi:hypothetical protein